MDAPKPKANLRRGVQATNLLQPQWPQPRVAPAISRDATPPLLPGWKEPSYKSPMAVTEPKLRVGLPIPSLDESATEARGAPPSLRRSSRYPYRRRRPRKVEFTRNLGRRRASRPTKSRRNGGPRRRNLKKALSRGPTPGSAASSTSSRTTSPARGRPRGVGCMRGGPTCSYRLSSGRRGGGRSGTRHRRAVSRRIWGPSWGEGGGHTGAARTSGERGVAGHQPAAGRLAPARRRRGLLASSASATGGRLLAHRHGAVVN